MKYILTFILLVTALSGFSQLMTLSSLFDQGVDRQRKAIYLSTVLSDTSLSTSEEFQVTIAGLHLMHEKDEIQSKLLDMLSNDYHNISIFLNLLEDTTNIWDVDKLTYIDLLEDIATYEIYNPYLSQKIQVDLTALRKIQELYNQEMISAFGKFNTRSITIRRKMWDEYIQFLKIRFTFKSILSTYNLDLDKTKNMSDETRSESSSIWGYNMPAKTVVLTFDDGPNYKYTAQTLEILKKKNVPAIFFELGNNIGTQTNATTFTARSAAKYSKEIAQDPRFLLGSHTLTHPLLTKLDSAEIEKEVANGFEMVKKITGDSTSLFRPPYGGVNNSVINVLANHSSKPFMWNIDSRDWADPIPASIANRVVNEAVKQGRGIILMHDIHQKTIQSLELIIDSLRAKGFEFVLWDGNNLFQQNDTLLATRGNTDKTSGRNINSLYNDKWALIIGINKYKEWPQLQYAVNDAQGIKTVLIDKLEFKEENILLLENEAATRKNILQAFGDHLINENKIKEDDAVFIFYAGHGMTRTINDKKSLGYIIPVDADRTSYISQAISMSEINDLNEMIPARHVFWVMDACYSGLALTRSGGASNLDSKRYIKEVTSRRARQIITAGGATEEVADGGPNGHSIFTWSLINALSGDADINGDGFITASEICNYVPPNVSSLSKQTPAYGNLIGSSGGDFIFQLKPGEGDLNETTSQLDSATSSLLQQIAELKEQLSRMQSSRQINDTRAGEPIAKTNETLSDTIQGIGELNSLGLHAYQQKKYSEALAFFLKAVEINPIAIQPINNLGFVYFKMGKFSEALPWIQKAIELSPTRMVAYLNLADIQLALNNPKDAIKNYEIYLSMAKESGFTNELRKKIQDLKSK